MNETLLHSGGIAKSVRDICCVSIFSLLSFAIFFVLSQSLRTSKTSPLFRLFVVIIRNILSLFNSPFIRYCMTRRCFLRQTQRMRARLCHLSKQTRWSGAAPRGCSARALSSPRARIEITGQPRLFCAMILVARRRCERH